MAKGKKPADKNSPQYSKHFMLLEKEPSESIGLIAQFLGMTKAETVEMFFKNLFKKYKLTTKTGRPIKKNALRMLREVFVFKEEKKV